MNSVISYHNCQSFLSAMRDLQRLNEHLSWLLRIFKSASLSSIIVMVYMFPWLNRQHGGGGGVTTLIIM